MKTEQHILDAMKSDAFWAYLELCNALEDVPRKEIYNSIKECDDVKKLNEITSMIEKNHSDFEKGKF